MKCWFGTVPTQLVFWKEGVCFVSTEVCAAQRDVDTFIPICHCHVSADDDLGKL